MIIEFHMNSIRWLDISETKLSLFITSCKIVGTHNPYFSTFQRLSESILYNAIKRLTILFLCKSRHRDESCKQ